MRKQQYKSRSRSPQQRFRTDFSPPERLGKSKSPNALSSSSFFERSSQSYGMPKARHTAGIPRSPTFDEASRRHSSWGNAPSNDDMEVQIAKGKLNSLVRRIDGFVQKSADLLQSKPRDPKLALKQKKMLSELMEQKSKLQGEIDRNQSPAKTRHSYERRTNSTSMPPKSQFGRVSELLSEMQGSITCLLSKSADITTRGTIFEIFEKFKERLWSEVFSSEPEIAQLERERKDLEMKHSTYLTKLNEQMAEHHEQDQARIELLCKERNKLSKKLETINGEVHGLKIACEAKDRLIEVMEKKSREYMPQKDVLKMKFKAQELKNQCQKVTRAVQEKETEIENLKETLQFERSQNETTIAQLKNKIRAIGDEFHRTEQNLQPDKLVAAFEKEKIKYINIIEGLKSERKTLKNNVRIAQEGQMLLETEMTQIRAEMASREPLEIKLQAKVENQKSKIERLNQVVQDLKEQNAELQTNFAQKSHDLSLQQQIAKLQLDIEETEEQKLRLQRKLEKAPIEWQNKLSQTKVKYKRRIEDAETEAAEARDASQKLKSEIEKKKSAINKANTTNERLEGELVQLKTQLRGSTTLSEDLESKLKKMTAKYNEADRNLSELANQLGGSPLDLPELLAKASIAAPDLTNYTPVRKLTYKGETFTVLEDPAERVAILPSAKAPGSIESLEAFKSETEVCIDMLLTGEGTTLDKVTALLNEPKIDANQILKEAEFRHRREVTELKEKLKRYEDNLFSLNQLYETSKSEVQTLKDTVKTCENALNNVQEELLGEKSKPPSVSQADHFELQTRAKVQEMEMEELRNDLEAANQRCEDIKQQLASKHTEKESLRQKLTSAQSEYEEIQVQLEEQKAKQKMEAASLQNSISLKQAEVNALRMQISSLTQAQDETQVQLAESVDMHQVELKQLQAQLREASAVEIERDQLKEKIISIEADMEQLQIVSEESKKQLKEFKSSDEAKDLEIQALLEQVHSGSVQLEEFKQLRAQNAVSADKEEGLLSQIHNRDAELAQLRSNLVEAQQKLEQLQSELSSTQEILNRKKTKISQMKSQQLVFNEDTSKNDDLIKLIASQDSQLVQLTSELASSEQKVEDLTQQLGTASAKLRRKKAKLAEAASKHEEEVIVFQEEIKRTDQQVTMTKNKYKAKANHHKEQHATLTNQLRQTAADLGISQDVAPPNFLEEIISRLQKPSRPRLNTKNSQELMSVDEVGTMIRRVQHKNVIW